MLPTAVQTTSGVVLQVIDYVVQPLQAVANSAGIATITYDTVDPSQLWRVERIVLSTDSPLPLDCTVYGASILPINIRDWTPLPVGFNAVAEYPQPVTIQGGAELQIVATGAAPGDVLTANVQYALVQRVPGS